MTVDQPGRVSEPIVYLDHSDIHEGRIEELRAGIREVVDFVEAHEPQLVSYAFYLDEAAAQMTVVAVHPDSSSLEFHLEVAGAGFRKLADFITLRRIEVYGRPSPKALDQLRQKLSALGGGGGPTVVNERSAGFLRET